MVTPPKPHTNIFLGKYNSSMIPIIDTQDDILCNIHLGYSSYQVSFPAGDIDIKSIYEFLFTLNKLGGLPNYKEYGYDVF